MSLLPIGPDTNRRCFSSCLPETFCRCRGEWIEPWAPEPEEEGPAPASEPVDPPS